MLDIKEIINLEQKSLARGILASPIADYMIVQSDMSKDAMKKYNIDSNKPMPTKL